MTPHKDFLLAPCPPAPTFPQSPLLSEALQVCHPHAAGSDIGAAEPAGAVPPGCAPQAVRRFDTCTADLDALADWLLDCGVTTVAMESTRVYWMPLFARLEARGMQVLLIEPRQAQCVPGRSKTDRLDCTWLQRLPTYGLLAGALRPDAHVGVRPALAPQAPPPQKTHEPRFDARTPLYHLAGVDLTTIEGIEEGTAWVILSEIGTAMATQAKALGYTLVPLAAQGS